MGCTWAPSKNTPAWRRPRTFEVSPSASILDHQLAGTVLQCFGDMLCPHLLHARQIGNGSRSCQRVCALFSSRFDVILQHEHGEFRDAAQILIVRQEGGRA